MGESGGIRPRPNRSPVSLSTDYEAAYGRLLEAISVTTRVEPATLTAFWPMVGHAYDGSLLVIGRAVNGWIDHIDVAAMGDPRARATLLRAARRTAEGTGDCPMRWVTDRWSPGDGAYSTARSAFWRHVRGVLGSVDPASRDDPHWSSRVAWSNLIKLAPADGGNPGGTLLDIQRTAGVDLLAHEIAELAPRRILVLTGRWWFEPFAHALDLHVSWRSGLVVGTAHQPNTTWVIAGHPQGKPRAILDEVIAAFGDSGGSGEVLG
jgi:hypothetical protein